MSVLEVKDSLSSLSKINNIITSTTKITNIGKINSIIECDFFCKNFFFKDLFELLPNYSHLITDS